MASYGIPCCNFLQQHSRGSTMTSSVVAAAESRTATTMRVGVMAGVGDIALQDIDTPEPGRDEILVRLHATAICTWEQRSYSGAQSNKFPFVGGHESAGVVAAIGPGHVHGSPDRRACRARALLLRQVPLVHDRAGPRLQAALRAARSNTAPPGAPAGSPSTRSTRRTVSIASAMPRSRLPRCRSRCPARCTPIACSVIASARMSSSSAPVSWA